MTPATEPSAASIAQAFRELDTCGQHTAEECAAYTRLFNRAREIEASPGILGRGAYGGIGFTHDATFSAPAAAVGGAAVELLGIADTLVASANNPVSSGGVRGLQEIMKSQAERLRAYNPAAPVGGLVVGAELINDIDDALTEEDASLRNAKLASVLRRCRGSLLDQCATAQSSPHFDDESVDRFAVAMKEKLAKARAAGRHGWEDTSDPELHQYLSDLLREHVEKGDPRDVANFCMFLHQRGESIAQPSAKDGVRGCEWCNGTGWLGGPSYAQPDEGGVECTHCNGLGKEASAATGLVDGAGFESEVQRIHASMENGYTIGKLRQALSAHPIRVDQAMVERYCGAVEAHLASLTPTDWLRERCDPAASVRRVARIGLEAAIGREAGTDGA